MKNPISNNLANIILFVFIAILNITFTQLPLINVLSYESSAINGIILSLIVGMYWLKYIKVKKTSLFYSPFLIIAAIPFLILTFSTILCQKCPLDDGLYFYLILALPSIIVGLSLAYLSYYISVKYRFIIFILIWIVILFSFLPELYLLPQIYFYNPIFGYFPGTIYDQNIEITELLIIYRLLNIIIAFIVIFVSSKNFNEKPKAYVYITLSILLLSQISFSSFLGFNTTLTTVESELKGEISSDHFNIIFPDTLSKNEQTILQLEHEYSYYSISKSLGFEPESKITSIIYGTGAQKKQLFGSANADVAKPWLNQIYLNLGNYQNSLKHEIAHIFSAKYGVTPFKIPSNINPGLIEGFAMAIENNYDDFDIDYLASLAYQNNFKISLVSLFTDLSFFSNVPSISYIYAGSFFKYLASNYGWEKVSLVYSGQSFEEIYKKNLSNLENEYYDYLTKIPEEDNSHIANYYFGGKPLIKLTCARVTAKALSEAQILLTDKKYEESAAKYLEIYKYSNSYAALVGYSVSSLNHDNVEKVIPFLEQEIKIFDGTSSFYYLQYILANFYVLNNDSSNAAKYYSSIIDQNPNIRYLRNAKVRLDLLAKGDSILINYIKLKDSKATILVKYVLENPNDYVVQLLLEFSQLEKKDYKKIIELVENIIGNKQYSSYTYFEISNYAYQNLDFITSLIYAKKALIISDYRRNQIIKEQILKLNWILNKN